MTPTASQDRTNSELLKTLRTPVARFYPCDLHVHSLGSYDVCLADKYSQLPDDLRAAIIRALQGKATLPLAKIPSDPGEHDAQLAKPALVQAFFEALIARRNALTTSEGIPDSDNWAIIGITDHNTSHFSAALAELAWNRRNTDHLIILPGIELEISFPLDGTTTKCQVHVLCLFAPCTKDSDIRLAINEVRSPGTPNWDFGHPIVVSGLPDFIHRLRSHVSFPAVCIGAHVWSNKGIENEPKKVILAGLEAEIVRLEAELDRASDENAAIDKLEISARLKSLTERKDNQEGLHLDVLRLIGQCGLDALQVRDQSHETHYRRLHRFRDDYGRAVPIICSDAHTPSQVFTCETGVPYAKVSKIVLTSGTPKDVFGEVQNHVLRYGETRTTYASPGAVTYWIEGIEIVRDAHDARKFWNGPSQSDQASTSDGSFTLSLSRNLNCLVGGRGSGKSAAIEAVAFLADEDSFAREGAKKERDRDDWYRRAAATLSGCRLRLVWKSTGRDGIGALPKRALIASRYFDPAGQHQSVDTRDANGNAIVDDSIALPRIRLLRAHEIETTAQSQNLRALFDDLCGTRINELNTQIEDFRSKLAEQRRSIVDLCKSVSVLMADNGPLRQYGIRKQQFETVDKPELRMRYDQVDRAEAIDKTVSRAQSTWSDLTVPKSIGDLETQVTGFFDDTERELVSKEGAVRDGYSSLYAIVHKAADGQPKGHREAVISGITAAKDAVSQFETAFSKEKGARAKDLKDRKDDLAKEGLPTGSGERDAKKRAYEAAQEDYGKYVAMVKQLDGQLIARKELHDELVLACQERTTVRKTRADELTTQLSKDLDPSILRIEIDARPLAERTEFVTWLEENIEPTFGRFQSQRRAALVESGLMPAALRAILLDDGDPALDVLHISRDHAKDGRVDANDANKILATCRGRKKVPLDESATWEVEFANSLPDDIRNGVTMFPVVDGGASFCIDRVLMLDEIVLDDLPEVRLNDRPDDPQSEPRPLDQLSPGQRCSAILPILLLSGDYPLVIDQPEENLDNRLIRQVIVNILATMKLKRQVIIATHNPNLPVLGDVEQCIVLQATGRDLSAVVATGNLDSAEVARYITDIMEGGREAFQYRQTIYQAHWGGPIEDPAEP